MSTDNGPAREAWGLFGDVCAGQCVNYSINTSGRKKGAQPCGATLRDYDLSMYYIHVYIYICVYIFFFISLCIYIESRVGPDLIYNRAYFTHIYS